MAASAHFGCPKFTFDRISGHFRSISNLKLFLKCLTKWLMSAILEFRNSLSIAFQAISDWYGTLIFLEIFDKWLPFGHFGCPKFTLDHISGHFRSIQFFFLIFFCKMAAGVIGSDVPWLDCPACNHFGMGHNGHGINLYGVSMTLMGN